MIYKILRPTEWSQFESDGRFGGSPDDRRDGFIHCSSREQVGATAARFFFDEPNLVVVAIDERPLGDLVRWEPASNGELFPHLYASLGRDAIVDVHHLEGASKVEEILHP
ncbi:MAG TPA: DUF952 domain-containing protein [Acidimicrobiales bacterium]